jgi:ketosteroid isomerase-like protein
MNRHSLMLRALAAFCLCVSSLAGAAVEITSAKSPLAGQTARGQSTNQQSSEAEREILKLHKQLIDALNRGDRALAEPLFAGDLTATSSGPGAEIRFSNKEEYLAGFKPSPAGVTPVVRNVVEEKVRVYGDTAVLNAATTAQVANEQGKYTRKSRSTNTFVRRNGRWQIVAMHVSIIREDLSAK